MENILRLVIHLLAPLVRELAERATDHDLLKLGLDVWECERDGTDFVSLYSDNYRRIRFEILTTIKCRWTKASVKTRGSLLEFAVKQLSRQSWSNDARIYGCPAFVSVMSKSKKARYRHARDYVLRLNDEKHKERADRYYENDIGNIYWNRLADELGDRGKMVSQEYVRKSIANRRRQRAENVNAYQGWRA